jgi:adenosylcobinamide-phosphate synthase
VTLFGRLIALLDRGLNRNGGRLARRRLLGVMAAGLIAGSAILTGLGLSLVFAGVTLGWMAEITVVAVMIAQRSLDEHVAAVARGFRTGGLTEARRAVSRIVGRDPDRLDEAGVCRAAIESLAENFSDGVVAPTFWYAVAGLPGILAYKAINTADSMIGHRSERHLQFGWAAARLDDLVNLPASRLSALLIVLAALPDGGSAAAVGAVRRDAGRHRSPNAGWPEAAMAGALDLALAGPRIYAGTRVEDGWMNEGGRTDARPADIVRGLRLFRGACILQAALVALLAAI